MACDNADPCEKKGEREIVVCGVDSKASKFRLKTIRDVSFEPQELTARVSIVKGLIGSAEVESVTLAGGVISKRLMFRLTMPF